MDNPHANNGRLWWKIPPYQFHEKIHGYKLPYPLATTIQSQSEYLEIHIDGLLQQSYWVRYPGSRVVKKIQSYKTVMGHIWDIILWLGVGNV